MFPVCTTDGLKATYGCIVLEMSLAATPTGIPAVNK